MEKMVKTEVITPGTVLSRQLVKQRELVQSNPDIQRLAHQQEAMSSIKSYLENGGTAGYVEMATASGKSYLIAMMAKAAAELGMRTLILAPTTNIADQLYGDNGEKGLGKFTDLHQQDKVGRRFGEHLGRDTLNKPVVVTTYQSLNSLVQKNQIGNVDLILADEAHRSLGEVTSVTMAEFSPQAIKVGFTATPEYTPDRSVTQILPDRIFGLDIRDSVERGLTPSIRSLIYETNIAIPMLDPSRSEFTDRELETLISMKQRNDAVVKFAADFVGAGLHGAIACVPGGKLAHPRRIAETLNETEVKDDDGTVRFIRAEAVGSHREAIENRETIEAFDRGEIDVLTFVQSLEQGWDSTLPRFMINASPTTSLVKESQLLGRLLRGEDEVVFVDFLDRSKKQQVTSLHVLGEARISAERKIGGRSYGGQKNNIRLADILHSDLYDRLESVDGMLLSELNVREADSASSYAAYIQNKWNKVLEQEGLGETLPALFEVKDFAAHALAVARKELGFGDELSSSQIEDVAHFAAQNGLTTLRKFSNVYDEIRGAYMNEVVKDIDDYEISYTDDRAEQDLFNADLKKTIERLLDYDLNKQAAYVIRGRFGIGRDEPAILDVIGDEIGVTRERVRQIESKALAKLRDPSRSSRLKEYAINREKLTHAALEDVPAGIYLGRHTSAKVFEGDHIFSHAGRTLHSTIRNYTSGVETELTVEEYLILQYEKGVSNAKRRSYDAQDYRNSFENKIQLRNDMEKLRLGEEYLRTASNPRPHIVKNIIYLRGFVAQMKENLNVQ